MLEKERTGKERREEREQKKEKRGGEGKGGEGNREEGKGGTEERMHSLPELVFKGKLVIKSRDNQGQSAGWCDRK